jgi:mono/diheme cytochrome c family protein
MRFARHTSKTRDRWFKPDDDTMTTINRIALDLLRLTCAASMVLCVMNAQAQTATPSSDSASWRKPVPHDASLDGKDPLVQQGGYLARAGDCIACHTASKGIPFAGGLPLKTPFGVIYSTNITPDKVTGIGNYTYDNFAKALREGVAADGHRLYPAMPYPSFSKINDSDMHALYAYFMQGVQPVSQPNKDNGLKFPFNIRALMMGWNLLYRPKGIYQPDPQQSAEWNRGAYLVQGLAHCSACHTPHGITGQELAFDEKGNTVFLSGFNLDGWHAPNLRSDVPGGLGRWSEDDVAAFLRNGRNDHTAAFGAMSEAVADSTQYLSNDDLHSIAVYLKSLPPHAGGAGMAAVASGASGASDSAPPLPPLREGRIESPGAAVYLNSCNACHRSDGTGASGVFPALAGNSAVQSDDPTSLIHIVLSGSRMPSTQGRPAPLGMPGFGWRLNDAQIADVLNFVRSSWGNQAKTVTVDQVKTVRASVRQSEQAK